MDAIERKALRLKEAPTYLSLNKNHFNRFVRPYVTEVKMSPQCILFDRLELDQWFDEYKRCNGRPPTLRRENLWDAESRQDLSNVAISGTSTNKLQEQEFARVRALTATRKRKDI